MGCRSSRHIEENGNSMLEIKYRERETSIKPKSRNEYKVLDIHDQSQNVQIQAPSATPKYISQHMSEKPSHIRKPSTSTTRITPNFPTYIDAKCEEFRIWFTTATKYCYWKQLGKRASLQQQIFAQIVLKKINELEICLREKQLSEGLRDDDPIVVDRLKNLKRSQVFWQVFLGKGVFIDLHNEPIFEKWFYLDWEQQFGCKKKDSSCVGKNVRAKAK
ncbi:1549_t:CDS:2 [Ambispora leptoticha]|uniref:1549_t:CDS:1 n=1 Tax=Ambispora leptoticha TaxID=144679 RepID=A0A9N9FFZ6_9GLOM|nr:1549_t:CDS:2 [Ambispora leptoticha]